MEQQQQSLFDVSIIKLQHEQLRHGVEPRLLRFVLINNALRSLQGHMLHVDDEVNFIGLPGSGDGDGGEEEPGENGSVPSESSDVFFYNTFKNGSLSSIPLSPPTPVKVMKLDTNANSDQSPLVEFQEAIASSPCPSQDALTSTDEDRVHPAAMFYEGVSCNGDESDGVRVEDGGGSGNGGLKEKRLHNGCTNTIHTASTSLLGKRSRTDISPHDHLPGESKENARCRLLDLEGEGGGGESLGGSDPKKHCKPTSLIISSTLQKVQSGLNGFNSFLDLDPFPPTLPFPSSSHSSPGHSPHPSPSSPHYHHATPPHYATSAEDNDKDSLTPSPIDFTNVDPTLYDFDTGVLGVGSTSAVSSLDSQETNGLPNQLAVSLPSLSQPPSSTALTTVTTSEAVGVSLAMATTSSSTPYLTSNHLSSSSSPLQSSPLCLPQTSLGSLPTCHSPLVSSLILSTDETVLQHHDGPLQQQSPQQQGECSSCDSSTNLDTMAAPHFEQAEKVSVVSADSMVLAAVSPGPGGSPAKSSCSMEAILRGQSADGDGLVQNGGSIGSSSGGSLATSPEHSVEPDFLDEIDHIVELLMT